MAPAELEDVVLSHPAVAEAAVIGIPDLEAGELPMACVVLKPGQSLKSLQLQDYVAGIQKYLLPYTLHVQFLLAE